jgi:hypothetical protein
MAVIQKQYYDLNVYFVWEQMARRRTAAVGQVSCRYSVLLTVEDKQW